MSSRKLLLFALSAVTAVVACGSPDQQPQTTPPPQEQANTIEKPLAPPKPEPWSVETHGGSEARLEQLSSGTGAIRITIPKLVGKEVFNVKVNHVPFSITKGTRYTLRFRARSDSPRRFNAAVGHNHDPWGLLGLYTEVNVAPEWKQFEFPFEANATDPDARIFFDLGGSDVPIELSDVVLREEPATPSKS